MTADHHRQLGGVPTTAPTTPGAIWLCRVCHRTNARGWQVCQACGVERPARRSWMQSRAVRLLAILLAALVCATIGVVVLSAWGAVISGPWILPAIGVWLLGCLAAPVVAWMRRA